MLKVSVILLVLTCSIYCTDAAKILMIPFFNASHFIQMDGVGRPLLDRGHDVYVLLDETITLKSSKYKIVSYKNSGKGGYSQSLDPEFQIKLIDSAGQVSTAVHGFIKTMCIEIMSDTAMFAKLEQLKLDLVIVDNFFAKCFFLVPHKLGVPFVTVGSLSLPWQMRLPFIPSVIEPQIDLGLFGSSFCTESDSQLGFLRRFCRMMSMVLFERFIGGFEEEYLHEYAEFRSVAEIRENASFHVINQTPLLSTPLPKLPHVEYVGGLSTSPAKPLPKELNDWMAIAENVVVVSFGSRFVSMPRAIAENLMNAFGALKNYRFLFRFKKTESNKDIEIPKNVRAMDWLPQNDALGHNSTRAFITHSGYNGMTEALFHGVPTLCFYIHADQGNNAKNAVKRGFGLVMNLKNFTAEELSASITELIENPKYSSSVQKASKIFHSEKHPSERAADAIEHVLKFGGEHLRPKEAYLLSVAQYYMLDVLALVYFLLFAIIVLTFKLLKFLLCKVLRSSNRQTKQKAE